MDPYPITRKLLRWYAGQGRDLPWRHTRDPYSILVSEIMLQQTRVETVVPYYRRFLAKFPDLKTLAQAPENEVLKTWENLGYYSRARYLRAAAKEILARWKGVFPQTQKDLLTLPGVGEYTAAALLSIAFGRPVAAVDGNVSRVISRVFALRNPVGSRESRNKIRDLADQLLSKKNPGRFNQAVMDLGSAVCTPRIPSCSVCPLRDLCRAKKLGLEKILPVRPKKPLPPHKQMTAAVITDRKKRLLVVQRPASGLLGGLWKFPGGEKQEKETVPAALARTVQEELGLRIRVGKKVASVNHAYTHFTVTYHVYRCAVERGRAASSSGRRCKWVPAEEISGLALSKAERKILGELFA